MALIKKTCEQGETLEQRLSDALLWDTVNLCWVLNVDADPTSVITPITGTPTQVLVDDDGEDILDAGNYTGGAIITNTGSERVFIGLGFTPTATNYTCSLAPIDGAGNTESKIIEVGDFAGDIEAITASGTSNVNITAFN